MGTNTPNVELTISDHLPGRIEELEADLKQAVAKVLQIQTSLVKARTLVLLSPQEGKEIVK